MKKMILALAVLAAPRAHASSCHGGGGGGGSSSSGGGGGGGSYSSGSSSSSSSGSSSSACSESTDVEGYRECHRFGEWAQSMVLPHMFVEMGGGVRRFVTWLPGRAGSVTHGDETFAYRVAMPTGLAGAGESAVTWNGRFGIGFAHGLYVGLEGEMGALAPSVAATPQMQTTGTFGAPTLVAQRGIVIGVSAIAGARITSQRGAIAFEAAGGVRDVQYAFDSTYHDCEQTTTIGVTRGVVEARVRAEARLGPWFTAGMTAGTSLVDRGDFMTGVYLGMHTRSFR